MTSRRSKADKALLASALREVRGIYDGRPWFDRQTDSEGRLRIHLSSVREADQHQSRISGGIATLAATFTPDARLFRTLLRRAGLIPFSRFVGSLHLETSALTATWSTRDCVGEWIRLHAIEAAVDLLRYVEHQFLRSRQAVVPLLDLWRRHG